MLTQYMRAEIHSIKCIEDLTRQLNEETNKPLKSNLSEKEARSIRYLIENRSEINNTALESLLLAYRSEKIS